MSKLFDVISAVNQMGKKTSMSFAVTQLLSMHGFYHNMSDEAYLSMLYKRFFKGKKKLDLKQPETLTEKVQWLKLYDHRDIYTRMVDKYEAKKVVAERVGEEYVIPTLGVWDNFEEIDFDTLPDQFVLKCTHDSGGIYFCKDKASFNREDARTFFERRLTSEPFWQSREWAYKNIKPRILAEPLIEELGNLDSVEYKVSCFDGRVGFITVCRGIAHSSFDVRKNDFYDRDFKPLPFRTKYYDNSGVHNEKPEKLDEIIRFCEAVAQEIPYVRIDFYLLKDKIFFGEATFYTWGGFIHFVPEEWDRKLGDMIKLPQKGRKCLSLEVNRMRKGSET